MTSAEPRRYVKVGKTTELTLAEARGKAKEIKASIALGADPRAEAKAEKAVLTFNEFFDQPLPTLREAAQALLAAG